jgi:hypothetical protein
MRLSGIRIHAVCGNARLCAAERTAVSGSVAVCTGSVRLPGSACGDVLQPGSAHIFKYFQNIFVLIRINYEYIK